MSPSNFRSVDERKSPNCASVLIGANGTRFGKYLVEAEEEPARQARVRVFRALDRDTGRPVTLKVLSDVRDQKFADQFRREVASISKVRNANVVAIYELGEYLDLPFAAMQYVGSYHLGSLMNSRQSLTLLQKMLIMEQVVQAVLAVHRGGLAYVGLRPSGIALDAEGSALIHDFGVVRLTTGYSDENQRYAPPEELAGDGPPDSLCDAFAWGVICYELLTG